MNIKMSMPAALLALCTGAAFGQATNSADVTGTVTDTTGAVVPGVTIAIKDIDKGMVRTITSNGAGLYDSGPIVANDNYTITFSREGFETLQRGPMLLQVGQIGLNVQLAVGQATQQVVVNENAPLLQTTSAELVNDDPDRHTAERCPSPGTPDWQSFLLSAAGHIGKRAEARRTLGWAAWRQTEACRFQPPCWMALRSARR